MKLRVTAATLLSLLALFPMVLFYTEMTLTGQRDLLLETNNYGEFWAELLVFWAALSYVLAIYLAEMRRALRKRPGRVQALKDLEREFPSSVWPEVKAEMERRAAWKRYH